MKIPTILLSTVLTALFVSGCGKKEATTAPGAGTGSTSSSAAPADPAGPRAIEITAGDNMRFSLEKIEAKPGEQLRVTLSNIGTMPRDAMGHNWVLLKKGADATAFATAAMTAKETDYIPASMKDQVISHTELLGPRKTSEISFAAPTEAGEYVFLCSFPGHFLAGMKGVLVVK
jgi:azurin